MSNDLNYIFAFVIVMIFFSALILLGMPEEFQLFTPVDLVVFTSEVGSIAGFCVVATGLPCAGAIAVWVLVDLLAYVITDQLIKLLISTPIMIMVIYILMKLARGTG